PPSLALALIRQESDFNPSAVSPAGAVGLMQLKPSTAELMAKDLNMTLGKDDLIKPRINLKLGCQYLKKRLEEFKGNAIPAIASYNAGPSTIKRWISKRGYPPHDLDGLIRWIEFIPYQETRNYVQKVLETQTIYDHLIALKIPVHKKAVPSGKR